MNLATNKKANRVFLTAMRVASDQYHFPSLSFEIVRFIHNGGVQKDDRPNPHGHLVGIRDLAAEFKNELTFNPELDRVHSTQLLELIKQNIVRVAQDKQSYGITREFRDAMESAVTRKYPPSKFVVEYLKSIFGTSKVTIDVARFVEMLYEEGGYGEFKVIHALFKDDFEFKLDELPKDLNDLIMTGVIQTNKAFGRYELTDVTWRQLQSAEREVCEDLLAFRMDPIVNKVAHELVRRTGDVTDVYVHLAMVINTVGGTAEEIRKRMGDRLTPNDGTDFCEELATLNNLNIVQTESDVAGFRISDKVFALVDQMLDERTRRYYPEHPYQTAVKEGYMGDKRAWLMSLNETMEADDRDLRAMDTERLLNLAVNYKVLEWFEKVTNGTWMENYDADVPYVALLRVLFEKDDGRVSRNFLARKFGKDYVGVNTKYGTVLTHFELVHILEFDLEDEVYVLTEEAKCLMAAVQVDKVDRLVKRIGKVLSQKSADAVIMSEKAAGDGGMPALKPNGKAKAVLDHHMSDAPVAERPSRFVPTSTSCGISDNDDAIVQATIKFRGKEMSLQKLINIYAAMVDFSRSAKQLGVTEYQYMLEGMAFDKAMTDRCMYAISKMGIVIPKA